MESAEETRGPEEWAEQTWVNFGAKVRELRKERGWTQTDLATRLATFGIEMHQTTVAKLEGGTRPTAVHEIWALAKLLDSNYQELLPPLGAWEAVEEEVGAAIWRYERLKGIATAAEREAERARVKADKALEELQRLSNASMARAIAQMLLPSEADAHGLPP